MTLGCSLAVGLNVPVMYSAESVIAALVVVATKACAKLADATTATVVRDFMRRHK